MAVVSVAFHGSGLRVCNSIDISIRPIPRKRFSPARLPLLLTFNEIASLLLLLSFATHFKHFLCVTAACVASAAQRHRYTPILICTWKFHSISQLYSTYTQRREGTGGQANDRKLKIWNTKKKISKTREKIKSVVIEFFCACMCSFVCLLRFFLYFFFLRYFSCSFCFDMPLLLFAIIKMKERKKLLEWYAFLSSFQVNAMGSSGNSNHQLIIINNNNTK